ncbi:MAG TPA: AAA family ATPase [Lacipirellula sp.]
MAAAAWTFTQPVFHAYATLRVHSETPHLAFKITDDQQASQFEVFKRTQRELVLGDGVLLAALGDPTIKSAAAIKSIVATEDPVIWLRNLLQVDFPGNAEIMTISMKGEDAALVADLVNAVLDAYVKNVIDVGKQQRTRRLAELHAAMSTQEEKSRRLRSKLQNLTDSLGSGDTEALSIKQQVAIQRYAQLQEEFGRIQFDRLRAEIELARITDQLASQADSSNDHEAQVAARADAEKQRLVDSHHAVVAQAEVLHQAQLVADEASSRVGRGGNRILKPYHERVQREQQRLEEIKFSVTEEIAAQLARDAEIARHSRAAESRAEQDRLKRELEILRAHEKTMGEQLAAATAAADKIGTSSVTVELTRNELDRLERIYDEIGVEAETLTIELSSASRVEALGRARRPEGLSPRDRIKKSAAFAILGLMLPCLGLFWLDAKSQRIGGVGELYQADLRVLGAVPLLPRRSLVKPQPTGRDATALRESIDRIRTLLIRQSEMANYRVIQVTSAIAGEGKTTFARQLAKSLARAHRRTVLLDFDLRCPAVHAAFGISLEPGVCDMLTGHRTMEDVLVYENGPFLAVAAAGRRNSESLASLTSEALERLLLQAREQFEFVIIDSSPALPVVDALLIGQRSDATIMTALRDVSRAPLIHEAIARLHDVGANVIGSVVTTKENRTYYRSLDRYAAG